MLVRTTAEAAPLFAELLAQRPRILVLSHINPDGDAIGSLLGLTLALHGAGYEVTPIASSAPPHFAAAMPGFEHLRVYRPNEPLPAADLLWLVDTAEPQRVGPLATEHAALFANLPLCVVDHHATNSGTEGTCLVDDQRASCAELLLDLIRALGLPLSTAAATNLLLGITTDTQSFQVSSTKAASLRAAADLLDAGADQQRIVRAIYFNTPLSSAKLSALATQQMHQEGGLVWVTVSKEMIAAAHADDEATEEVVSRAQRIAGMEIAAIFKERRDGQVKLSLRSTPEYDVAKVCQIWGGGGHRQAAGASLPMPLAEAVETVLPHLRALLEAKPSL